MSRLHCTLLQADLIWENKEANLQKLESMIAGIVGAKELVILPEMFNTGFSLRPEFGVCWCPLWVLVGLRH